MTECNIIPIDRYRIWADVFTSCGQRVHVFWKEACCRHWNSHLWNRCWYIYLWTSWKMATPGTGLEKCSLHSWSVISMKAVWVKNPSLKDGLWGSEGIGSLPLSCMWHTKSLRGQTIGQSEMITHVVRWAYKYADVSIGLFKSLW